MRNLYGKYIGVLGLGLGMLVLDAKGAGAAPENPRAVEIQLAEIQKTLEGLEEGQKAILEGQKKLSEEHTQLRYWIHNR